MTPPPLSCGHHALCSGWPGDSVLFLKVSVSVPPTPSLSDSSVNTTGRKSRTKICWTTGLRKIFPFLKLTQSKVNCQHRSMSGHRKVRKHQKQSVVFEELSFPKGMKDRD